MYRYIEIKIHHLGFLSGWCVICYIDHQTFVSGLQIFPFSLGEIKAFGVEFKEHFYKNVDLFRLIHYEHVRNAVNF